jgi:hypothetical protein
MAPKIMRDRMREFCDNVFEVISAFSADNNQRFVAEVEAIEL